MHIIMPSFGGGGSHDIHLITLGPLSETKYDAHIGGRKEM
jgi:hypothetical protein